MHFGIPGGNRGVGGGGELKVTRPKKCYSLYFLGQAGRNFDLIAKVLIKI